MSFLLLSAIGLKAQGSENIVNHKESVFLQKTQANSLSTLQQLSEKEESETENDIDLELVSFELPFLNTPVIFIAFESARVADSENLQRVSQPVYIFASTFRI